MATASPMQTSSPATCSAAHGRGRRPGRPHRPGGGGGGGAPALHARRAVPVEGAFPARESPPVTANLWFGGLPGSSRRLPRGSVRRGRGRAGPRPPAGEIAYRPDAISGWQDNGATTVLHELLATASVPAKRRGPARSSHPGQPAGRRGALSRRMGRSVPGAAGSRSAAAGGLEAARRTAIDAHTLDHARHGLPTCRAAAAQAPIA